MSVCVHVLCLCVCVCVCLFVYVCVCVCAVCVSVFECLYVSMYNNKLQLLVERKKVDVSKQNKNKQERG